MMWGNKKVLIDPREAFMICIIKNNYRKAKIGLDNCSDTRLKLKKIYRFKNLFKGFDLS